MNPPSAVIAWADLPGGEYLPEAVADLAAGRESLASCLISIAFERLREAGLALPGPPLRDPELRLYRLLQEPHGDAAHAQYNAHVRRLNKLCRALELARRQGIAVPPIARGED